MKLQNDGEDVKGGCNFVQNECNNDGLLEFDAV
jgi:hypothetical protein